MASGRSGELVFDVILAIIAIGILPDHVWRWQFDSGLDVLLASVAAGAATRVLFRS